MKLTFGLLVVVAFVFNCKFKQQDEEFESQLLDMPTGDYHDDDFVMDKRYPTFEVILPFMKRRFGAMNPPHERDCASQTDAEFGDIYTNIVSAASHWEVDPMFLLALISHETGYCYRVSGKNGTGLGQMTGAGIHEFSHQLAVAPDGRRPKQAQVDYFQDRMRRVFGNNWKEEIGFHGNSRKSLDSNVKANLVKSPKVAAHVTAAFFKVNLAVCRLGNYTRCNFRKNDFNQIIKQDEHEFMSYYLAAARAYNGNQARPKNSIFDALTHPHLKSTVQEDSSRLMLDEYWIKVYNDYSEIRDLLGHGAPIAPPQQNPASPPAKSSSSKPLGEVEESVTGIQGENAGAVEAWRYAAGIQENSSLGEMTLRDGPRGTPCSDKVLANNTCVCVRDLKIAKNDAGRDVAWVMIPDPDLQFGLKDNCKAQKQFWIAEGYTYESKDERCIQYCSR